jgi:hypothetical protein
LLTVNVATSIFQHCWKIQYTQKIINLNE